MLGLFFYLNTSIMFNLIGIGKENGDKQYTICIFLYNKMVKLTLYTVKHKKPTYYYYNKNSYKECMKQGIISIKWFFGIHINTSSVT